MRSWIKWVGGVVAGVLVIGAGVFWFVERPALSIDADQPPQFVTHDFIDLETIASVSKFRSGEGHDFSGNGESCRSMKHYFTPPFSQAGEAVQQQIKSGQPVPPPASGTGVPIYAPMDAKIRSINDENTPIGKQFELQSTVEPSWSVRLFHVYPADGITVGMRVAAGQRLGVLHQGQGTDVAVQGASINGFKLVSYFQVMTDAVFATYQARGISSRDQLIISKQERDAHPLQCNGEQFVGSSSGSIDPLGADVYLSGYSQEQQRQARESMYRAVPNYR